MIQLQSQDLAEPGSGGAENFDSSTGSKGEPMRKLDGKIDRRTFLQGVAAAGAMEFTRLTPVALALAGKPAGSVGYKPARIENEYSLFLAGEREALSSPPLVAGMSRSGVVLAGEGASRTVKIGEAANGWKLLAVADFNGAATAIFEKHVTHRGSIAYVTVDRGVIASIPKVVGQLGSIRPRPVTAPDNVRLERVLHYVPGPDVQGNYILHSDDDPCYENVAALGSEFIGWTLAGNEEAGPLKSVFLDASATSRQLNTTDENLWDPDIGGALFDPANFLPDEGSRMYEYLPGYSKRTLLGGYLPVADVAVWNPRYKAGYECIVLVTPGEDGKVLGRVRFTAASERDGASPETDEEHDRYFNGSPEEFYAALAGIWNHWRDFYETSMPVEIPDPWLLDAARAGITLSRVSYRGLRPTYQVGEGAYTKIPERSHALFPVAHYEFVWAQQLWNLTADVDPYFQYYLDHYILPDGNFLYNTQDQVEAPLNAGIVLANSARSYDYTGDVAAFAARLPILERMLGYVLRRYEYSKQQFAADDPHHGLIWGSPEADLGDPQNDFPQSHPYYYQNAVWTWRGIAEHQRCLHRVAREHNRSDCQALGDHYAAIAEEMRTLIQRSLAATLAHCSPEMKAAGITPFTPEDTHHDPRRLESYENHRFMMDWFTADWGDAALDLGHLRHRELAGMQIVGLHTDGAEQRTSNFMAHGTLAVRIRQQDYRPFLLTLYALTCYAADSGSRYAPEDAWVPGGAPGQGSRYGWSTVVNSVLQPALGLRWLLCYEESNADVCHLQKAAPRHWFAAGERIKVSKCPTRFGQLSWSTVAHGDRDWQIQLDCEQPFAGEIFIHIHAPDGRPIEHTSAGNLVGNAIHFTVKELRSSQHITIRVS
jgi:hypothetical protein